MAYIQALRHKRRAQEYALSALPPARVVRESGGFEGSGLRRRAAALLRRAATSLLNSTAQLTVPSPLHLPPARFQVDLVFTLQQFACLGCIYLFERIEHWESEGVAAVGGLTLNFLWLFFCYRAIERQSKTFFCRYALFGLIQPGFLIFFCFYLLSHEQCRRFNLCRYVPEATDGAPEGEQVCTEARWFCPEVQNLNRYVDVWELPVVVYAVLSASVRLYFVLFPLRVSTTTVFGMGAKCARPLSSPPRPRPRSRPRAHARSRPRAHARRHPAPRGRLHTRNEPWRVPTDLQNLIADHGGSKQALALMVEGANVHIEVSLIAESAMAKHAHERQHTERRVKEAAKAGEAGGQGGQRAFWANLCHELVVCFQSFLVISKLLFLEILPAHLPCFASTKRKKLRKQRSFSGVRHCVMSQDLSTLRWSWFDYILIHEIKRKPEEFVVKDTTHRPDDAASAGSKAGRMGTRRRRPQRHGIELEYISPEGSRMQLCMTFDSIEVFRVWLLGLQVLYAVNLVEEPAKVHYLQSVFRMAHSANPGLAEAEQLPQLAAYLNYYLSAPRLDAEMRHAAVRERAGGTKKGFGAGRGQRTLIKRHLHFREFLHLVQRLSLVPAVEALMAIAIEAQQQRGGSAYRSSVPVRMLPGAQGGLLNRIASSPGPGMNVFKSFFAGRHTLGGDGAEGRGVQQCAGGVGGALTEEAEAEMAEWSADASHRLTSRRTGASGRSVDSHYCACRVDPSGHHAPPPRNSSSGGSSSGGGSVHRGYLSAVESLSECSTVFPGGGFGATSVVIQHLEQACAAHQPSLPGAQLTPGTQRHAHFSEEPAATEGAAASGGSGEGRVLELEHKQRMLSTSTVRQEASVPAAAGGGEVKSPAATPAVAPAAEAPAA